MKIKVVGAAGGEVTGSAYLVMTEKSTVLVDAGMFQGGRQSEEKNKLPEGATPVDIQAVLLTHGHLDHTGRLPLLVKYGYDGPVYATEQTIELSQIILEDSARLQSADAIRHNKKAWKKGEPMKDPLYSTEHVDAMRQLFKPVKFDSPLPITDDITARWIEAGHMLGSGSIELIITEQGKQKTVVFSGDLGPTTLPLLRPFDHFRQADLVFLESTYGDRNHKSYDETIVEFESILREAVEQRGKIFIPTFAIGRAQQIIYHMAELFHSRKIPAFPVYLDSPMAIKAIEVYKNHQDLLDEEFQVLKSRGVFPLNRDYFQMSPTADTSRALNELKGPCMILAGAGMCNGGRILHHLYHNLSQPDTHVIIVGYQSHGSLGRKLVERSEHVKIFGEDVPVKAQIHTLGGFSAHAGQSDLLDWFSRLAPSRPGLVITHGENGPRNALAQLIKEKYRIDATLPEIGDIIEI